MDEVSQLVSEAIFVPECWGRFPPHWASQPKTRFRRFRAEFDTGIRGAVQI